MHVCVVTDLQAQLLEHNGEIPDCDKHDHIPYRVAAVMVGPTDDGMGKARWVGQGRRRITALRRIIGWRPKPCSFGEDGSKGPSIFAPIFSRREVMPCR